MGTSVLRRCPQRPRPYPPAELLAPPVAVALETVLEAVPVALETPTVQRRRLASGLLRQVQWQYGSPWVSRFLCDSQQQRDQYGRASFGVHSVLREHIPQAREP